MKRELAILRALLRNYHKACNSPRVCRFLLYSRENFSDDLCRAAAQALLFNFGDWEKAKRDLQNGWLGAFPGSRLAKLFSWAGKILGGAQ